jgi:hypothetical protein
MRLSPRQCEWAEPVDVRFKGLAESSCWGAHENKHCLRFPSDAQALTSADVPVVSGTGTDVRDPMLRGELYL